MASYADEFAYHMTVSPGEIRYGYATRPDAPLSRLVLNDSGVVERLGWDPGSRAWNNFFQGRGLGTSATRAPGRLRQVRHVRAVRRVERQHGGDVVLQLRRGVQPRVPDGCRQNVPLDCGGDGDGDGGRRSTGSTEWFAVLPGVKLPDMVDSRSLDTSVTLDQCRARCLANCSCVAYAAADIRGGGDGTGCLMWARNLIDLRYVDGGQTLYLRQARPVSEAVQTAHSPLLLPLLWPSSRAQQEISPGGMWSVKGKLPRGHPLLHGLSGRAIAVKRLKPISDLPEAIVSYFTREKQVMSGLQQHQNVVRLLAYCEEGGERILVETNGSRVAELAKEAANNPGDCRGREAPARGRGVGRQRDPPGSEAGQCAAGWRMASQVADFGTAKQLQLPAAGATGTRTIIGTPGYMAPEYVQSEGGETTLNCDVYSFGVTLLETLAGRRNWERQSLVSEAWRLWAERSITALLDSEVAPAPAKPELRQLGRCIHVGLLCVQEKPGDRPSMSEVVEMLSSSTSAQQQLVEPRVPMVGSRILAMILESDADAADLSRPTVYETMGQTRT
ncbi:unnamed protein product [Miscanthus lutarioriparius]|uniref:Uncharacterized protein n=1 Tax=Miscanthus lutarioriparius TaxID=422564 RepID=A0A811QF94_9POAL|nr:unnamed protein product [Miscanthus lutarioriparius]